MPTESSLAASEPDFKRLVEGVTDVIWSTEIDGTFNYLSPQFKSIFGLEPQEWIGQSPAGLVHPDDIASVGEVCGGENEGQTSVEFRHLCGDGNYIWVAVNAVAVLDEEGNKVCRQGTIRDISERKRIEKEQARLVEILQSTSDFVGICKPEVGILWQNKPFRELRPDLDIDQQDVPITELYPDWAREVVMNEGMTTAVDRGIWSGETALLDSLGNELPTSQVVIAHKSDDGEVEYFSTILRDISEVKRTEQALRDAQAQLQSMTQNVPGVISRLLLHPDGSRSFAYVSPNVRELFGLDPDALMKDVSDLWNRIHPDDLEEVQSRFQTSVETGEPLHASYRLLLGERDTRWVEMWSLPSWLENGDIAFDGIAIDVTDREVAEQTQPEAQSHLLSAAENIPGVIYRWIQHPDGSRNLAYVSPNVRQFYGLDPQVQMADETETRRRIPPEDMEEIDRRMNHSAVTLEPYQICHRFMLDNETRWIESFSFPSRQENGDVYFDGIVLDVTRRVTQEIEQGKAQAELVSTTENVPGVIFRAVVRNDGSQQMTYVSPSLRELLGIDSEALLADMNELWKRIHPDDVAEVERRMRESMTSLEPYRSVHRLVVEGRDTRWVESLSMPTKLDNGDIVFNGIVTDTTDRIAEEQRQEEAQAQLRDMTENVPGVISRIVLRADGSQQLTYISPRVSELFELDPEDLMADMREVWKRIHPDDVAEVERKMQHSAKTLAPNHSVYRLVLEEKGTRWVEAWSLPSRLDNGDIVFDGIVMDVTELGRLNSLERDINFRQIFDNAPHAVFLIEADGEAPGRIAAANKAAEGMHGYSVGELIGKKIMELDAPDAAQEAPDRLQRLAQGEELLFEVNHIHKDGTVFPVEVTASRILIDGRAFVLAFDRDLTDSKKAEAERRELQDRLIQSQKLEAVGQLAAGIAHEFNNIIASVSANTETILNFHRTDLPSHVVQPLEAIDAAGERAAGLTKQLLSIVRRKRTDVATFDVNSLVNKQMKLLQPLLGDGVVLQSRLTELSSWVRANESELENALLNLCVNARDAVDAQGEVGIRTELVELERHNVPPDVQAGRFVRLSVSDNGCGISQEQQARIFEPFFTTKLAGKGTGLGLSIVAANVANCNGFVTVESEPNMGSVFHVHLPLVETEDLRLSAKRSKQPPMSSGNSETILVCDDDPMVLSAISGLVEALGYEVISVDGPAKAIEAMQAQAEIVILITDISMKGSNGLQLGLKLKQLKPDLEVICISGYGEEFIASIEDVQFEFIAKPFRASELSKKIRRILDHSDVDHGTGI